MNANMQWSVEHAAEWYARQPRLCGANYVPAYAVNQLEMWQPDTFDPAAIDREFGWAARCGLNAMRVFLHDLLWVQDRNGFLDRIDRFLELGARHGLRIMPVFFDSCWHPFPRLGRQPDPEPGVHNAGWVQSPGAAVIHRPSEYPRLEAYVKGVVTRFARDPRVLAWDIWNEPGNMNAGSYKVREQPQKEQWELALLPRVFEWVREAGSEQPLTSPLWIGEWGRDEAMSVMARTQIAMSDVISFHSYEAAGTFAQRVHDLKRFRRPLLCTEYMARGWGNTIADVLPIAVRESLGLFLWGFVRGRTQTIFPWSSWQQPFDRDPPVPHHDLLHPDGTPFDESEIQGLREFTAGQETRK